MTIIDPNMNNLTGDAIKSRQREVGEKQLSRDDFIKLFLTQLRIQDPMKPMDSGAMMQQMSQLTSLTSTQELEKTIQGLSSNMAKSQAFEASQLIGKRVDVASSVSPLVEGQGLQGSVILPNSATNVKVDIADNNGKVIKTVQLGSSQSGVMDFAWDGKDAEGNAVKPDYYHISASATVGGQQTSIPTAGTFRVNSVAWNQASSEVILNVDGMGGVNMADIIKIL